MKTSFKHTLRLTGAALITATALVACGGSSIDTSADNNPSPVDTFFSYVSSLVASLRDTEEPVAIDQVEVTTPETTEPEPVAVAN